MPWLKWLYHIIIQSVSCRFWYSVFIKLNLSIVLADILESAENGYLKAVALTFVI